MFSYNSHSLRFSLFRQTFSGSLVFKALFFNALIACASFLLSANLYAADIEVVEAQPSSVGVDVSSRPSTNATSSTVSSPKASSSTVYRLDDRPTDTQTELLLQLQVLQSEMMQLRGMVEEQAHHIEQLQQRRLDDYVDLDRRIGELAKSGTISSAAVSTANTATTNVGKPSIVVNTSSRSVQSQTVKSQSVKNSSEQLNLEQGVLAAGNPQVSEPVAVSKNVAKDSTNKVVATTNNNVVAASSGGKTISVGGDSSSGDDHGREVYKAAYDKVKNRKFDEAKVAMVAFVGDYPNHRYVPNAYFWIGELYYHDSDMEESKDAFNVLVQDYPEHRKVPDAKFKLAKILHQSGDSKKAKRLLESVIKDHSASRVAKPAKEYLANSVR